MLSLLASLLAAAIAPVPPSCAPDAGLSYICGIGAPEDLLVLPGGDWAVASSMTRDRAGGVFLIERRMRTAHRIAVGVARPGTRADPGCPGPPDPAAFVGHGVALRPGPANRATLFVVNHGGRESIELFDVDLARPRPVISWTGCIVMTGGVQANAVTPLRDGGLIVTALTDADKPVAQSYAQMAAEAPSGAVYEWRPDRGLTRLPLPPISGPNGVVVSPDERWMIVAGFGDRRIWRIDRTGAVAPRSREVTFLPDNLRYDRAGNVLATGPRTSAKTLFACAGNGGPSCNPPSIVLALDPVTLETKSTREVPATDHFGSATTALDMGGELWIGSFKGDRIAILPVR